MSQTLTVPKNFYLASIAIALIGCIVTLYSTSHHLDVKRNGSSTAVCNINDTFSCDDVAKSEYSEIYNIPLGVFGLGFFVGILGLSAVSLRKDNRGEDPTVELKGLQVMGWIGVAVSIVLALISYFQVGSLCVTCIGVYVLTISLLVILFVFKENLPKFELNSSFNGALNGAILVGIVIVVFKLLGLGDIPRRDDVVKDFKNDSQQVSKSLPEIPVNKNAYSGLGEDYRKGNDQAKVTIIEFADFQCPACQQAGTVLSEIHKQLKNEVLIVFKNYPLDNSCNPNMGGAAHDAACDIAILARCAGREGKFWQYHDLAFAEQRRASKALAKVWAKSVGLSNDSIQSCLKSKDILAKIQDDVRQASSIGLTGTPTILINNKLYDGPRDTTSIRRAVDYELSAQ